MYASTACLVDGGGLWRTLERYREAGLSHVELGHTTDVGSGNLADALVATGLHFAVHNYFPPPADSFVLNLASPDAEVRRRSLELVRTALELAAAIDAALYSVHAGFVADPTGFDDGAFAFPATTPQQAEDAAKRFAESLHVAADAAAAAGVTLLVENNVCVERHRGALLLQTADEFESLFDSFGRDDVGILVDTGHLNVSAHTWGFDRAAFIRRLAPHIGGFHLHDNGGVRDEHLPARPGSWALTTIADAGLGSLPVIVEARFADASALADHVRAVDAELRSTPDE